MQMKFLFITVVITYRSTTSVCVCVCADLTPGFCLRSSHNIKTHTQRLSLVRRRIRMTSSSRCPVNAESMHGTDISCQLSVRIIICSLLHRHGVRVPAIYWLCEYDVMQLWNVVELVERWNDLAVESVSLFSESPLEGSCLTIGLRWRWKLNWYNNMFFHSMRKVKHSE